MEKVDVIDWDRPAAQHEHLNEHDYDWLKYVVAQQAGVDSTGAVVAFDLGEFRTEDWRAHLYRSQAR
jgi:hypothetical protein